MIPGQPATSQLQEHGGSAEIPDVIRNLKDGAQEIVDDGYDEGGLESAQLIGRLSDGPKKKHHICFTNTFIILVGVCFYSSSSGTCEGDRHEHESLCVLFA